MDEGICFLGVKYYKYNDRWNGKIRFNQGDDVQFGISETRHVREDSSQTAYRGVEEEMLIRTNQPLQSLGTLERHDRYRTKQFDCYLLHADEGTCHVVPRAEIDSHNTTHDDRDAIKPWVIVYGSESYLESLARQFQPAELLLDEEGCLLSDHKTQDIIEKVVVIKGTEIHRYFRR
jgi:hypothetical protein